MISRVKGYNKKKSRIGRIQLPLSILQLGVSPPPSSSRRTSTRILPFSLPSHFAQVRRMLERFAFRPPPDLFADSGRGMAVLNYIKVGC